MRTARFALVLLLTSAGFLASCGSEATQRLGDMVITVLSVDRAGSQSVGVQQFTPQAGYEYAIVKVNIRWPDGERSFKLESDQMFISDAEGNDYGYAPYISHLDLRSYERSDMEYKLTFEVKQGVELTSMTLHEVTFKIGGSWALW